MKLKGKKDSFLEWTFYIQRGIFHFKLEWRRGSLKQVIFNFGLSLVTIVQKIFFGKQI